MVRSRRFLGWPVLVLLVMLVGCFRSAPEPADLVVLGGRVITMDPDRPQATALATRGQRIVAVGSEAEIRTLIGPSTEVLDMGGAVAVPGLIEGHAHFLGLGQSKMQLDLRQTETWDEIVAAVAEATGRTPSGQWIRGRGWHQERWRRDPKRVVRGMPVHDDLSAVSPDNPVVLTHASGHAVVVNARAMELLGITAATPDPPGGEIVRDGAGRPTGVLLDVAGDRAEAMAASAIDETALRHMVELASRECLAHGITSFQDAGATFEQIEVLRAMAEGGELGVRLWVMLGEPVEVLAARLPGFRVHRAGHAFLTVGGIKRYADGALGSHSAWLLEPYADLADSVGLAVDPPEVLREAVRLALEHELQLCTHAIGDRANRAVLDIYGEALGSVGEGRRWRIEHAQHLHPGDVSRFAELGVIAAMQPVHCTSDGPWVAKRLGPERARERSYLWRSMLDAGVVIAAGTDAPVEAVDPIGTFYSAVTRRMADGTPFFPEQAMTRDEALQAMTLDAAYAAFEEDIKGSLEVGKLADVTVLSQDLLTVAEDRIPSTRVLATIVGGEVRFRAE